MCVCTVQLVGANYYISYIILILYQNYFQRTLFILLTSHFDVCFWALHYKPVGLSKVPFVHLYSVHCTMYICIVYNVQFRLMVILYTSYNKYCAYNIANCNILYCTVCILYCIKCILYAIQYTVYSIHLIQCTLYSIYCVLYELYIVYFYNKYRM